MSTVVVGCDVNNSRDHEVQNTVCKALEKAGHKVEKLPVDSNEFATYDWGERGRNPRGKIGVYIIADGIFSIADRYNNSGGFKYAYFIIRGDLGRPRMKTRKDFETRPIGADGDCTGICNKLRGKSFVEINKIVKKKCWVVFGRNGKEMADELIKAMGGDTSTSSSSSSKSNSASSSGSTIKEALKKATSKWDGDVEIRLIGDTVHVNKIKDPTTTKLVINENDNALYDNINVTDINPGTINHLTCTYKNYDLTLKDDLLIKRFGKIKKKIACPSSIKSLKEAEAFLQREFNKIRRNDGRSVECKLVGDTKWREGVWVRVFLPSYFIDDYMYISKCSHDEDANGPWTASLTLVDYPPSFGADNSSSNSDKSSSKSKSKSKTKSKSSGNK